MSFFICLFISFHLKFLLIIMFFVGAKYSFDVQQTCRMAAYTSCRSVLETFGKSFVKTHRKKCNKHVCKVELSAETTMTDVFKHFEVCKVVAVGDRLLGDDASDVLVQRAVQLPSAGNFAALYSLLSEGIHTALLLRDSDGRVIVPYDLPAPEKRFLVRFFLSRQDDVVIHDVDGSFRAPRLNEISTPSPSPPSSDEKQKRKKPKA